MANELRTRFIVSSSVLMTIAVILLLLGFYCTNKANELDDEAWKDLQAGETNKYLEKSIDSNGLRYFSLIFYSVGSSVLIISIALLIIGYPKRIDPLEELSHLYLDRLVVDDDFKDKRRKELIKKMKRDISSLEEVRKVEYECTECGATVNQWDKVCQKCGERFEDEEEELNHRNLKKKRISAKLDNVSSLVIRLKRDFDKEIISEKQYYSTLKKYKRITLHLRKELANKDKKYGKELEYRRKRKPPMGRGRESYSRRRPNKEKKEESEYHWDRLP